MTENEKVKKWFKSELSMCIEESLDAIECEDIMNICLKVFNDWEQYKAIGTIEKFKDLKEQEEALARNASMVGNLQSIAYNKAIDEFAEQMKADLQGEHWTQFCAMRKIIDEVAEQMKAGGENE